MTLINLTPHEVVLVAANTTHRLPPAAHPARIIDTAGPAAAVADLPIPVRQRLFSDNIDGLPSADDGVYYVVSRAIAMVAVNRADLLVPGPLHTLSDGRLGCTELLQFTTR